MCGRRRRWGKKWRENLEGDEFGQEEMRRGEMGIKKERKDEPNESESARGMDGKRV